MSYYISKGSDVMAHHHRRKGPSHNPQPLKKGIPFTSILSKIDLVSLPGQLHSIANNMEKFSQISQLMNHADILGDLSGGKGFNLTSLLKNGNSLSQLLQTFSPALKDDSFTEERRSTQKKVKPISVKEHSKK